MRIRTPIRRTYPPSIRTHRDAWDRYGITILLVIGFAAVLVIPW